MRFDLLPALALAFYGVTFVVEKILLRGRRVQTNLDRGSLKAFDVSGVLSIPAGIVLGFTDYGRVRAFEPGHLVELQVIQVGHVAHQLRLHELFGQRVAQPLDAHRAARGVV